MATIINAHWIKYAEMGERDALARTRAAKDVSAVATVMFAVGKGERGTASHTDVRIGPFGRLFDICISLYTSF